MRASKGLLRPEGLLLQPAGRRRNRRRKRSSHLLQRDRRRGSREVSAGFCSGHLFEYGDLPLRRSRGWFDLRL